MHFYLISLFENMQLLMKCISRIVLRMTEQIIFFLLNKYSFERINV